MRQLGKDEIIKEGDCMVTACNKDRPIPCKLTVGMKAGEFIKFSSGEILKIVRDEPNG